MRTLRVLIHSVTALSFFSFFTNAEEPTRPHIVLVMADDQGWGDMAYSGDPDLKTPHFDQAAASGLRFDRFYAAAPVCSPTRASVLTGRTPNRSGVFKWGYPIRPQEITLAEALKSAGYATGHFGKWHLGSVRRQSPANPNRNGFDHYVSAPNFYDNDPILCVDGEAVKFKGESSVIAVDAALRWMRNHIQTHKDPLFAVIWFGSPHHPHRAAEEDLVHYQNADEKRRHFLGEISGMDRAYGKLRNALTELGIRENTILWYTSDNGALPKEGNKAGLRGNKGQIYEGGLLVPAILEWPRLIPEGRITQSPCVSSDIYPTLLDIVGAQVPNQTPLDGISIRPLIENTGPIPDRAIGFWDTIAKGISTRADVWMQELHQAQSEGKELPPHETSARAAELPNPPHPVGSYPGHAAWIEGNWKLHRIAKKPNQLSWELYNLEEDRAETTDLSNVEKSRTDRMRQALDIWLGQVVRSYNGEDY